MGQRHCYVHLKVVVDVKKKVVCVLFTVSPAERTELLDHKTFTMNFNKQLLLA